MARLNISEAMTLKLLGQIKSGRDINGIYIEYDRIVITFLPIPGQKTVEFFSGLEKVVGMDIPGLERGHSLTLSDLEGRMRVTVS